MDKQQPKGVMREDIYEYALREYDSEPEHLWMTFPLYAVLRRSDNKKWYAVVMDIPCNKIGLSGEDRIDILVIRCDSVLREMLMGHDGFFPAYHLNRENWITVLLDGSVDKETVFGLLDESYEIAKGKKKKTAGHLPVSRIVPVNPKYYDIQKAFDENDTILWKQSGSWKAGDTVYLYLAAPFSCILYKCAVVEADIPYEYDDGNVRMHKVMKINRLYTYENGRFGLDVLKKHGITTVRGPRGIPLSLRKELEKESENGART